MNYDYKKMKENLEVIRNVCRKYRNEITALSASYGLNLGLFDDCDDYISFVNELSFDEFVGNQLTTLCCEDVINMYRRIISGEMTFDEFVKTSNEEISKKYLDLIS